MSPRFNLLRPGEAFRRRLRLMRDTRALRAAFQEFYAVAGIREQWAGLEFDSLLKELEADLGLRYLLEDVKADLGIAE